MPTRREKTLKLPVQIALAALIASVGLAPGCGSGSGSSQAREADRVDLESVLAADDATQRAKLLLASGRLRDALAEFERAVEINPMAIDAHIGIGDVYKGEGDLPRAEVAYRRAANLGPSSFQAQYAHALVLQIMEQYAKAVRAYLRALQINPRDFKANMNLGLAFVQLGEPQQGLPYAERATRLSPSSGAAHHNLGVCYAAVGRHDEAIGAYRRASEELGLVPQLLLAIADSQAALEDHAAAASTLQRLINVEPSADAWRRLGAARFRVREYTASFEAFSTALEFDSEHFPALNGIAVCRLNDYLWSDKTDLDALEDAVNAMRQSLRIKRDQPKIIELLTRFG
ncbi:MAG: tetratricopeptide repeat protein [Planctomycetota bacterium]